ncbi:MAG: GNAT family N-acetyltransferase [Bacteroidales bacterium]|nr:GNAT family N-acetyltransferase [Bacteroidales bacterium]
MIRPAKNDDIPALHILWKKVFNDSDTFLDHFFRDLFSPGHCLLTDTDGTITSMLFLLKGVLQETTQDYPLYYIYACATDPAHRKKGLMGKLLNSAITFARKKQYELALVPATKPLFDYYRRFGFTQTAYLNILTYPPVMTPEPKVWKRLQTVTTEHIKLLQTLRKIYLQNNSVYWPDKHIEVTLNELFAQGGELLISSDQYALTLPANEKVTIVETAGEQTYEAMTSSLRKFYFRQTTEFRLPVEKENPDSVPYALFHPLHPYPSPYLNLALDI